MSSAAETHHLNADPDPGKQDLAAPTPFLRIHSAKFKRFHLMRLRL
jgi:hypothetical protein